MQKFFNLMMKIYVLTLFYKIFKDLDDWVHILKKTRVAALVSFLLPLECLNFLKLMISQIYFINFLPVFILYSKLFKKSILYWKKLEIISLLKSVSVK